MRKTIRLVGIVGLVITAVVIIAQLTLKGNSRSEPLGTPVPPVVTQPAPVSNTPTESTGKAGHGREQNPAPAYNVKGAVLAAVSANSQLSEAILLPEQQMRQIVKSTVLPQKQQAVAQIYLSAAQGLARGLNYQNRTAAQAGADYYVVTQKYLVKSFGDDRASIWLYNITHATTPPDQKTVQSYAITHPGQTPQGQEYYVPSITIVQLEWLKGRWYWTGTQDPPANMVPPAKGHPTFQEAVKAYLPYTRSFKDYANLQ